MISSSRGSFRPDRLTRTQHSLFELQVSLLLTPRIANRVSATATVAKTGAETRHTIEAADDAPGDALDGRAAAGNVLATQIFADFTHGRGRISRYVVRRRLRADVGQLAESTVENCFECSVEPRAGRGEHGDGGAVQHGDGSVVQHGDGGVV